MKILLLCCVLLSLLACAKKDADSNTQAQAPSTDNTASEMPVKAEKPLSLDQVLAMQDEDSKLRYSFRHPKETLNFFGIEPGMTVVEALPGGGWYTKILGPYLGKNGKLIGVDYDIAMWPNFSFVNEEFLNKRKNWSQEWPQDAQKWSGENGARVSAYTFASLPESLNDNVDAVLFIRALHNLQRFEDKGQFLSRALQESKRVLKSGGVIGVVQHRASADKSDEWADGSRGYLKEDALIARFEEEGFEFVGSSEINANAKDQPGEDDIVWRLPPNYATAKAAGEDEAKVKAQMDEIGESDRMTLLFRKPAVDE